MDEKRYRVFCNTCGNEMDFHGNDYHCEFCEGKNIFRLSKTNTCVHGEGDDVCGKTFGAVPPKVLDIIGTKHAVVTRMPFELNCKRCRMADKNNGKEWGSVADYFGMAIALGYRTPNEFRLKGLPDKFIDLCIEKSKKY